MPVELSEQDAKWLHRFLDEGIESGLATEVGEHETATRVYRRLAEARKEAADASH